MTVLSADALYNDQNLHVDRVNVNEVYIDHTFNCRGAFGVSDCIELARDIAKNGLQQPVIVRVLREKEINDRLPSEEHLIKRGFKYIAVAGHRRLTAYKINKAVEIPAIIKPKTLDPFDAKDINATENLQRVDLSLLQEAHAIEHYWMADWTRQDIANRIHKSPGWVQMRIQLLEMDPEIQKIAGAGFLKQEDIRKLIRMPPGKKRLQAAAHIRDQRKRGMKGASIRIKTDKVKAKTKKHRSVGEISRMMDVVRDVFKQIDLEGDIAKSDLITPQGNSFATRVMAWCCGHLPNRELALELRNFAKSFGVTYELPEFEDE